MRTSHPTRSKTPDHMTPSTPDGIQILEQEKRLSECLLWQVLENFYSQSGINAWEFVPSYITNNRVIAEEYADLVLSVLLDALPRLNPNEPVYILEIASGTGCFSAYFLEALMRKREYFQTLKNVPIRYLMSEFTANQFEVWACQPTLSKFLNEGILDFCVFRPEADTRLSLWREKKTLSNQDIKNPVIAIANYFFDSIPQDLFLINNRQLHEVRFTFFRELDGFSEEEPIKLAHLKQYDTYVPVQPEAYYADPICNTILSDYLSKLENAPFLFPKAAFSCIRHLQSLSNNNLVLLSSDKGFTDLNALINQGKLTYMAHGDAFSFEVNYHAILQYMAHHGAEAFHTEDPLFSTVLSISSPQFFGDLAHTRYRFQDKLVQKNPILNHYYSLGLLKEDQENKPIETVLKGCQAFIELSHFDPRTLYSCFHLLLSKLEAFTPAQKRSLLETLTQVQTHIYAIPHKPDFWLPLGELYYHLGQAEKCIDVLFKSIQINGFNQDVVLLLAQSHEDLKQTQEASHYYKQLLIHNPSCAKAKKGLNRLKSTQQTNVKIRRKAASKYSSTRASKKA